MKKDDHENYIEIFGYGVSGAGATIIFFFLLFLLVYVGFCLGYHIGMHINP